MTRPKEEVFCYKDSDSRGSDLVRWLRDQRSTLRFESFGGLGWLKTFVIPPKEIWRSEFSTLAKCGVETDFYDARAVHYSYIIKNQPGAVCRLSPTIASRPISPESPVLPVFPGNVCMIGQIFNKAVDGAIKRTLQKQPNFRTEIDSLMLQISEGMEPGGFSGYGAVRLKKLLLERGVSAKDFPALSLVKNYLPTGVKVEELSRLTVHPELKREDLRHQRDRAVSALLNACFEDAARRGVRSLLVLSNEKVLHALFGKRGVTVEALGENAYTGSDPDFEKKPLKERKEDPDYVLAGMVPVNTFSLSALRDYWMLTQGVDLPPPAVNARAGWQNRLREWAFGIEL